ncbi:hypothetical protein ACWV95_36455 [Streptomyces albus]
MTGSRLVGRPPFYGPRPAGSRIYATTAAGTPGEADIFSNKHTDLGRAWWQWGKTEQTAAELLSAAGVSPGEVRDRPAIRQIVGDLRSRHPRVTGVRELVAAAGMTA